MLLKILLVRSKGLEPVEAGLLPGAELDDMPYKELMRALQQDKLCPCDKRVLLFLIGGKIKPSCDRRRH